MGRFKPFDVLIAGMVVAAVLYAFSFGGLVSGHLGTDGAFGLSAIALVLGAVSAGIFLWAMLLDCLRRPFARGETTRALYVGLILLLGPVGALVYYWTVVRPEGPGPTEEVR